VAGQHVPVSAHHQRRRVHPLRFWQEYAVELADDYYGVYNFN
jgi:hypothetical protein